MDAPTPPACCEDGLPDTPPPSEEQIARVGKALAHPARIRILEQFSEGRPRMAHEVVDDCDLAQSTVSEHLRILREADVLFATKDGPRTWYCMRRSVLRSFAKAVDELTLERLPARALHL